MKIAVWTDASGQCASLIGAAQVRLYQPSAQRPDDWQLDQMLAVSLDEQGGLAVMRGQLEQVLGWMRQHECEDLVVSELRKRILIRFREEGIEIPHAPRPGKVNPAG